MELKLYNLELRKRVYGNYVEYKEKYQAFEKVADKMGIEMLPFESFNEEDGDKYRQYTFFEKGDEYFIVDSQKLLILLENHVPFTLKNTINTDISELFQTVAEKQVIISGRNEYNTKCEVHMPGNLLATYNEVCLLENSCTDVLQSTLDSGWSLLTVCPQPDQRRPDYILGRFNPNRELSTSAARKGEI